jgi:cell division protein FtsB
MARNRIKQKNTIQARRLWHWFAVCSLLTVFGLVLVFLQIRIHRLAETRSLLMQELEEVQQKNKALRVAIERHKHPDELKKKIAEFQLGMVEMSDPEIVVIETDLAASSTMARRRR